MESSKPKRLLAAGIVFVITVLYLLFIATPMQLNWGMTGLVLTELGLLAIAVAAAVALRQPLGQVFPLRRPTLRQSAGAVLLWLGAYPAVLAAALLVNAVFPGSVGETSTALTGFITTVPPWLRFLAVAVCPAVCEEALHRGFLLHQLKTLGNKWLVIFAAGLLFGVFHLDGVRLLSTGILGAALAYALLETGSMFYPFLIHLCNNSLSVLSTMVTEQAAAEPQTAQAAADAAQAAAAVSNWTAFGAYLMICAVCPWLLWAAGTLLRPKAPRRPGKAWRKIAVCTAVSAVCVAVGATML